ncbi:L-glutamate gamma-semialdehyde dehydrogenase [Leptolyngbya sp. FACHB-261]|uniref:L-glutamate gamma-semialdehyde dehydrogenase n=1 Tax=Leptolyngbya sp. FACHB-261 TaxID=2692806 RepID=UPI001687AEA2|nr:L-glutamate gamma-semialdehyde dehydrogenase [Leptolyngbya sp. FACHB-261]MBD2099444.1 L-glutamate gamma-semialdehyde dehydrogenase [Leptolyngbya sp. FACHB-261]
MVVQVGSAYELKTREIAQAILVQGARGERSFLGALRDQMRLDDKLMNWAMGNDSLRVQLFRFVDGLPSLRSKAEIARHLQEYLGEAEVPGLKGLLNFSKPDSPTGQIAATTVATAVETLARRYIAGDNIQQAIKSIERLRKERMAFTLDLLGEAVISEVEAESYLNRYLDLMAQLAQASKSWSRVPQIDEADGEPLPLVQVSVKLSAFYSQFDALDAASSAAKVSEKIRILLRRARELGTAVHFDMEQYAHKDLTLSTLKSVLLEDEFRTRTDVGLTLQGYLRDSQQDLEGLITWAKERGHPVTVRLVKGAYWDQETIKAYQNGWWQPVFNQKSSTDANYEALTRRLLENHEYLWAAIGSHNVRSLAVAIATAQELQIPKRRYELQMLYGMGDKFAKACVDMGQRVRIYCPYGELIPGMGYLIRRLLENTANNSFLRRSVEEGRPSEELLQPPVMEKTDGHGLQVVGFHGAANSDFSQAQPRQLAEQALAEVRARLAQTYNPWINGTAVTTADHLDSVNPSKPEEIVGRVGLASVEQAEAAVKAAKTAFTTWKQTSATQRADILRKAADLMEQRRQELAAWIVLEVGKPLREADADVSEAIDFCRFYGEEMERLQAPRSRNVPGETNEYHYQPRGVTLVIAPWNFPFAIPVGMCVAALAAGNTVVFKPAEQSSVIAAKFNEVLQAAGIPSGVFNFLPGIGEEIGPRLVKHPDVHLIVFTGSQKVGCQIYADAAVLQPGQKHLKRVIAEMGGKNAIIIDESADLDQAVVGVVQSAFGYAGQKCSACSRAIVLEPVYDAFVTRLVEATRSLNVGPADQAGTKVGPVIDAEAQARIQDYISKGRLEAEVVLEAPVPETGYFVKPTIFTGVKPDSMLAQEEIFGPVLAVIKASSFDEALQIANGTDYGLTGGLYSRTPSHIARARAEFEVGNLYINRGITGALVDRQPFGGFKLSGVGSKAGGPDYLLQFLEPRAITENTQRQGFALIEGADQ